MPLKFQLVRLTLTPVRVCVKGYSKTDRQIDRHTQTGCPKPFSRRFEGCTSQIPSYLKLDFSHDAKTSIDMEVKWLKETDIGNGSIGLLQALFFFKMPTFL